MRLQPACNYCMFSGFQPSLQSSRPKCLTNSLSKPFSQLHLRSRYVGQVEAMREVAIGTDQGEGTKRKEEGPSTALSDKLCGELQAALKKGRCLTIDKENTKAFD